MQIRARPTVSFVVAALVALALAGDRVRTCARQPADRPREATAAVHARRADGESGHDHTGRFHPAGRLRHRLVRPSPGWKRTVKQTGSGEGAVIKQVTYSGGSTPTGEDSTFAFLAQPQASKTYTFGVQQTYSDGSVVDWAGPSRPTRRRRRSKRSRRSAAGVAVRHWR